MKDFDFYSQRPDRKKMIKKDGTVMLAMGNLHYTMDSKQHASLFSKAYDA